MVEVYQEESRAVAESLTRWREKNPDVDITHETLSGHPVGVLARAGAMADLVVVGSRGRGGFASAVLGGPRRSSAPSVTASCIT
ncbi:nucleotide-binding universal stress UspA family protein [Nonomuraea thailandensis]|uniref:Nucleotide-binding universal stress UspA family protein n=1 Tax=Nonomuraea thailandensis TaxID=1188745 RepID=A0A9X2K1T3_9ACTN|nr:universal stress protein [Nonomuraea thailandensis]MCP2356664.1 nucleotide-binding universal stress UspA family protein [Nonomuraea thailandensis]